MIGLWLLMMIIMVNLYTSTLTSYLTVPKLKPIPNTLEELAASKRYQLATEKGTVFTEMILVKYSFCAGNLYILKRDRKFFSFLQDAKSGPYKILGDALRRNPSRVYLQRDPPLDDVLYRGFVTVQVL